MTHHPRTRLLAAGTLAAQEALDLDALVEAARAEPPITAYDLTGKIEDMAGAFSALCGIEATGEKVSAAAQLEMIIREAQASDVVLLTDTPAALAQLVLQGFVESYLPPEAAEAIPASYQDPLTVTANANVWAYNTEAYESCPVTNIWQLTEPEWRSRVAMTDPLLKASYTDWFSQMETHHDDEAHAAYEALYGQPIETDEPSATRAWVRALAANGPLLTDGDDPVSAAVGAPGQAEPFIGLMSSATSPTRATGWRSATRSSPLWAGPTPSSG